MVKEQRIIPLEKKHIEQLSIWHYAEWTNIYPDYKIENFKKELSNHLTGNEKIPCTWVLVTGSELIGSVSLLEDDLENNVDLNPWLGNLYVKKKYRNQGIGEMLLKFATAKAINWDVSNLFLYTLNDTEFYKKRGWNLHKECKVNEQSIKIMKYEISAKYHCTQNNHQ